MAETDFKTALILEGGGSKGAFEAGVIQYLCKNNLQKQIHVVCGTSVGGLNAACFAFEKVNDLENLWSDISNDQVYIPSPLILELKSKVQELENFAKSGIFSKIFGFLPKCFGLLGLKDKILLALKASNFLDNSPLEKKLRELFADKKISQAQKTLCLAAFNVETSKVDYFDKKNDVSVVDALMATSAVQGAFPPRIINGSQYIDGGNGANLAVKQAIQYGCNRLVMVRANSAEKPLAKPLSVWYSLIMHAYLASFGNTTDAEIKRADDISFRIKKELERNSKIIKVIEQSVPDEEIMEKVKQEINALPNVFTNKRPLDIIQVIPNEMNIPNILEFSASASKGLMDAGRAKAEEVLKRSSLAT